jgi:excisionase family DNA binding protein
MATSKPNRPIPQNPEPELPAKHAFTVKETAALLGVNHKTIREQITTGAIKAIRLGRSIRIPRSEVLKLLGA